MIRRDSYQSHEGIEGCPQVARIFIYAGSLNKDRHISSGEIFPRPDATTNQSEVCPYHFGPMISYRFARRCHLTEQIGARRRELYANDTWFPADAEIQWAYRREALNENKEKVGTTTLPGHSERNAQKEYVKQKPQKDNVTHAIKLPNPEDDSFEKNSREIECVAAAVSRMSARTSRETMQALWLRIGEIASSKTQKCRKIDIASFLEDYLCLYHRMGLVDATDKLVSSALAKVSRSEIIQLQFHFETLTCPSGSDLSRLRQKIETIEIKLLPTSTLVELIKLRAFLSHPLITSLINSATPQEKKSKEIKDIEWPSKTSMKRVRLPLDTFTRDVFMDELKSKSVSVGSLYRLEVLRPHIVGCEESQAILEKITGKTSEFLKSSKEAQDLLRINDNFRTNLFPVS